MVHQKRERRNRTRFVVRETRKAAGRPREGKARKAACRNGPLVKRPKTSASHADNSGSNPLRVTKYAESLENCIVGVDGDEGTPVPIPNTEVKLISVEDTWLDTARENRETPTQMTKAQRRDDRLSFWCICLLSSVGRARGC